MLNFDEFRAVSNRDKIRTSNLQRNQTTSSRLARNDEKTSIDAPKGNIKPNSHILNGLLSAIGEFFETHQMQSVYVILIILDTFAALLTSYVHSSNIKSFYYISNSALYTATSSFMMFSLLFFLCEIGIVILVFGTKVLSHFGYITDLLILIVQLRCEYSGGYNAKFGRLLNIFRFWRLFRLFSSMVQLEKDRHGTEMMLLDDVREQLRLREADVVGLRLEVSKERESRAAIESMLGSYKDEVDTLNEALRIAAMDIADVAQDDEDDEEEQGGSDGGDDDYSLSSDRDARDELSGNAKSSNKSAMMRAVINDTRSYKVSDIASSDLRHAPAAFLVHEDGSFEQK